MNAIGEVIQVKIIRTGADVAGLRSTSSLDGRYQAYLENLFTQLRDSLQDDEEDEFCLDKHGYIVLLEAGDDLRRLPGIGLDHLPDGLLGTWPEYVEEIDLEGFRIYRLLVLYDNEYGHIFLSIKGQLDEEAETWLQGLAE